MFTVHLPSLGGVPIQPWMWVMLWLVLLSTPLLGWMITTILAPRGAGSRLDRGAGALGWVPLGLVLLALGLRFLVWWFDGPSGGPGRWLMAWFPVPGSDPAWNLAGVLMVLEILYAAAVLPLAGLAALMHTVVMPYLWPRTRPFQVPQPHVAAAIVLIATFLSIPTTLWAYATLTTAQVHHLVDFVAIAPLSLVCLAIWTRYAWAPEVRPESRAAETAPTGPTGPDVVALWRKIGALSASATPLYTAPRRQLAEPGTSAADLAWRNAGGIGPAPRALQELSAAWREPDQGWLVPDLPDPTERIFLAAALLLAIREHGLPCLVVTSSPVPLRDAVDAGIQASGAWSCGPLVAGEQDLRAAFAGGRSPAAAFLSIDDLSTAGVRALASDLDGAGATWSRNVGLVVLSQVDRGDPLRVTHRLFTLQRLFLGLQTVEARWSVLATGFGGESTRAMVEKAFPGIPMREVPLHPQATAEVRVWLAAAAFRQLPGPPWVKRAAEPVVQAGFPVSVGDPGGAFGQRGIEIWGGQVSLVRDVALAGQASISVLNESWLVASFRALGNRVPLADGSTHDSLWGLSDTPVTRFLTRDNNLPGLHAAGQLHPPQALFGSANRLVAKTHLIACLRECHQALPTLEGIFGRSLVDEVVGRDYKPTRFAVRRHQGQLGRVPLAPVPDRGEGPGGEGLALQGTVTRKTVRVRHAHSGAVLSEVDAICAATRYYPGRVFAVGEDRFEVPPQAFDTQRAQILVEPVPATRPLTRPRLTIDVQSPVLVEAPQQYRDGSLSFRLASFEAPVTEKVAGFVRSDGSDQTYAPVTTAYRTRIRGVFFDGEITYNALYHLSRSFDDAIVAHLFANEEDLEVFPVAAGFTEGLPAGILAIDRFVLGMGAAEAMKPLVVREVLRWVTAILSNCKCPYGCEICTPRDVLEQGPDKPGVLAALGR